MAFILLMPGCVSCSSSKTSRLPGGGTTTRDAQRIHLSNTLSYVYGMNLFSELVFRPTCQDEPADGGKDWVLRGPLSDVGGANRCSREVVDQQIQIFWKMLVSRGNWVRQTTEGVRIAEELSSLVAYAVTVGG